MLDLIAFGFFSAIDVFFKEKIHKAKAQASTLHEEYKINVIYQFNIMPLTLNIQGNKISWKALWEKFKTEIEVLQL